MACSITTFHRLDKGQVKLVFSPCRLTALQSGDAFTPSGPDMSRRLFDAFEVFPGVVLPQAEYRFTR
jgi:hypothetical protein